MSRAHAECQTWPGVLLSATSMPSGFGRPSPPGEGNGCARTGLRGHRLRDANCERASVCQVGLTRVEDGLVSAEDSRYVVPPTGARDFDPWSIRIHHITPDTVRAGYSRGR